MEKTTKPKLSLKPMPSIKPSDIKLRPRMRKTYGDIDALAVSISELGLLNPIVIDEEGYLIAGERRMRACIKLGMEKIPYTMKSYTDIGKVLEAEYAENEDRLNFGWQERCLAMLDIFRERTKTATVEGWKFGQREAARIFSMNVSNFNYVLQVAKKLEIELSKPEKERKYWQYQSAAEAYRLGIMAEQEDDANRILAERAAKAVADVEITEEAPFANEVLPKPTPDELAEERKRYESNPHNTIPFEQYWEERKSLVAAKAEAKQRLVMHFSKRFIHGDCIEFMLRPENAGKFDHIITDPPYAIDMKNLTQGQNGGMALIDRVEDAHQVDENLDLLARFFPAAFACTKPNSFVVVFGDLMLWQYMYDLATKAGFAVQRWPIIWKKVNQKVMNNCQQYNSTKDYEIVMVCRKPSTTVALPLNTSFIEGSNVEAIKQTGHPFAKPFEVTMALAQLVSIEGQTILDPFAGGGSILLQLYQMGRKIYGVEKEPHHYNALLENLKRSVLSDHPDKEIVFT